MSKHFFTFLICIVFIVVVQAQPVSNGLPVYKKAQNLQEQGMYFEAIAAYKKAITLDKKFDSAHLALASLFLRIQKTDSAIKVLKNAVKIKPGFAAAHEMLGLINRDYTKNSKEAIQHYLQAVKSDSTNKVNFYSLAWCSNDLKLYEQAIRYAEKALAIDNNYRPAYNELGHAFHSLKRYAGAIETFKKHLAISVNEQPLYYSGLCYIELKDKDGAIKMYEELKKLNPKSADGLKKKIDAIQ
jgi:tetratricopeptide (TPR) repeat protein